MEWLFPIIFGWCGTYWPWRLPGGTGGGGFDPDNPWPVNCPMCGAIVGSISAVIIDVVRNGAWTTGFFDHAVLSLAAGAFGAGLVGGVIGLARGNKRVG